MTQNNDNGGKTEKTPSKPEQEPKIVKEGFVPPPPPPQPQEEPPVPPNED